MQQSFKLALVAGAGTLAAGDLQAAISYTNPGPYENPAFPVGNADRYQHQYKQFFDSLPNTPTNASLGNTPNGWVDDSTSPAAGQFSIPGWYLYHPTEMAAAGEGGANRHQRFRAGSGSAATGAFWSYGPNGSTDRALGLLNAETVSLATDPVLENRQIFGGLKLTNNSGQTLTEFTVKYDGEQWRRAFNGNDTAGAPIPVLDKLDFQYSLNPAATISSANSLFTDVDALDFNAPQTVGTADAALDGNAEANRTVLGPFAVTGVNWAPGTDLFLRWVDLNIPGPNNNDSATRGDHGLAIDNFAFSANVPEPTGLALLALGAAGLLGRRRNA